VAITLANTEVVLATLSALVGCILHAVALFLYLYIFGINVSHLVISLSSMTLAFAFIFGNSLRTVYESVVFLFVVRPYKVGDWIVYEGEDHRVTSFGLLWTQMITFNGMSVSVRARWPCLQPFVTTFCLQALQLIVFGNPLRNVYESAAFLFVIRPYNVGDWIVFEGEDHRTQMITFNSMSVLVRACLFVHALSCSLGQKSVVRESHGHAWVNGQNRIRFCVQQTACTQTAYTALSFFFCALLQNGSFHCPHWRRVPWCKLLKRNQIGRVDVRD
jgi:hypothetical protein